jgi:hypothetical protein
MMDIDARRAIEWDIKLKSDLVADPTWIASVEVFGATWTTKTRLEVAMLDSDNSTKRMIKQELELSYG